MAARCLRRHDEIVSAGRMPHRVSSAFLDRTSPLRVDVEDLAATGQLSTRLALALAPYRWGLLDECLVEGEHRDFAHEARRAHGCQHSFAVATLRHDQNRRLVAEARRTP